MNQSEYMAYSMSSETITMLGMVQGAGAAAPTVPSTTHSNTSSAGFMARSNNWVSTTSGDITRSGVGVYTVKLRDGLPEILDIDPNIWGTDGKQAQMSDYNATTRVISVKTYTSAGVAVDLATTDFLRFVILGQKNVPAY